MDIKDLKNRKGTCGDLLSSPR